jgi:hypothetical protein
MVSAAVSLFLGPLTVVKRAATSSEDAERDHVDRAPLMSR